MKTFGRGVARAVVGLVLAMTGGGAGADSLGLELGLIRQYFEYREPGIEEAGVLHGVSGELSYRWANAWVIGSRARVVGGGLDYDGRTWGGTPVSTDTNDVILRADVLVGRYLASDPIEVFAYTGVGTRYWNQLIEGRGGYEREITWRYLPIGVRLEGTAGGEPNWRWAAALEFRTIVNGTVKSHLSDVDPGFNNPENDVDRGYGAYIGLGAIYRFAAGSAIAELAIKPYLELWDVAASDTARLTFNGTTTLVYEPENETTAYGVAVSARF